MRSGLTASVTLAKGCRITILLIAASAYVSSASAEKNCDKPLYLTLDTGHMEIAPLVAEVLKRQQVADAYMKRLMANPNLVLPTICADTVMSWFVFVVRLATGYTAAERDAIIAGMRNHDVGAADYFPCIHLQPFYREEFGFEPGMFPIAESVSQRTIALPFYNSLSQREVEIVCATLEVMIGRENLRRG